MATDILMVEMMNHFYIYIIYSGNNTFIIESPPCDLNLSIICCL